MAPQRVVVVGNGRMAQQCSEILVASSGAKVALVVAERRNDAAQSRLARFCLEAGIPLLQPDTGIGTPAVLATVAAQRADFIFSIDNFQIFDAALLGAARLGCINFHNGPIERYRGVHAPSWAIFNDEKEHGITWHYMERSVDAGAIAAEDRFALAGTETALSLTLECIRVGVESFKRHLGSILAGHRSRAPALEGAKLYRRADFPDGGVLNPQSTAAHIGRLLRATDFRPFPNPFTYVRVSCPRGSLIVNEVHAVGETGRHEPGEIVVADRQLIVACADRLLAFSAVMLQPDETVSVADAVASLDLRVGQRLT